MREVEFRALRGRIIEKYGTYGSFSEALGVTTQAVSKMLRNKSGFTRRSVLAWAEALDISQDEIGNFFYPESSKELNNVRKNFD